MQSLIDERTKLIVVINPSNPLGSVFSESHLRAILALAQRNRLPILADEIYAKMVFGASFYSLGHLTDEVPVIVVGGFAKRWLVPGWRIGWGVLYDPKSLYGAEFSQAVFKCRNVMLHATTYAIKAIPKILAETPDSFFNETNEKISQRADAVFTKVQGSDVLAMNKPKGALYAMISIDLEKLREEVGTS
jgi:tyrosine aminotransferase